MATVQVHAGHPSEQVLIGRDGVGWCSGTLLCGGDLAISRGMSAVLGCLAGRVRLPVGMSQVRMASDSSDTVSHPCMGAAEASAYGKSFESGVSGVPETRPLSPAICL